jgi:hypothetical protein
MCDGCGGRKSSGHGALMHHIAYGCVDIYFTGNAQNNIWIYGHTHGSRNPTSPSLEYAYILDRSMCSGGNAYKKEDLKKIGPLLTGRTTDTLIGIYEKEIEAKKNCCSCNKNPLCSDSDHMDIIRKELDSVIKTPISEEFLYTGTDTIDCENPFHLDTQILLYNHEMACKKRFIGIL